MIRDKDELKLFSTKTLLEVLDQRNNESRFTDHPGGFSTIDIKKELEFRSSFLGRPASE